MIRGPEHRLRVERTARRLMGRRSLMALADKAANAINATAAGAFGELCYWLARTYAEGWEAGWQAARTHSGEVMPPPDV